MKTPFKRKARWSLEFYDRGSGEIIIPRGVVKIQSRPAVNISMSVLDANSSYISPHGYETHTSTYVDCDNNDGSYYLGQYLAKYFDQINVGDGTTSAGLNAGPPDNINALLRMWSQMGPGERPEEWGWLRETWDMEKVKFQSVNWGCVDYEMPHTEEMEVTFQYSSLEYTLDAFAIPVPSSGAGLPVFDFDQS